MICAYCLSKLVAEKLPGHEPWRHRRRATEEYAVSQNLLYHRRNYPDNSTWVIGQIDSMLIFFAATPQARIMLALSMRLNRRQSAQQSAD